MNTQPIGIFDSGLGGLSVWQEVYRQLPGESLMYYADQRNCPYGPKSREEVIQLCEQIVDKLLRWGCKLIVVACNTATTAAIQDLRKKYSVPFVGMEPAIKPAALQTKTKQVGVIATQGTFQGEMFQKTRERYARGVEISQVIGKGWVEIVESGSFDQPIALATVQKTLNTLELDRIDQLVLGCTHYPFLIPQIKKIIPPEVRILNPALAVSQQVGRMLDQHQLRTGQDVPPKYTFYSSLQAERIKEFMNLIFPDHPRDFRFFIDE